MIIKANTDEGCKTQIFKENGELVVLPISEYDTETQMVKHYVLGDDGKIQLESLDGKEKPVMVDLHLPGSHAEVDGRKV